jgi:tubulin monoglycylase TTLL3/8
VPADLPEVAKNPKPTTKRKTQSKKSKVVISPEEEKILLRHTCYRCFINKVNMSNNICVTSPVKMTIPAYVVYVGKGNNSLLLRNAFKLRWWWSESETAVEGVNMVWTQLR